MQGRSSARPLAVACGVHAASVKAAVKQTLNAISTFHPFQQKWKPSSDFFCKTEAAEGKLWKSEGYLCNIYLEKHTGFTGYHLGIRTQDVASTPAPSSAPLSHSLSFLAT